MDRPSPSLLIGRLPRTAERLGDAGPMILDNLVTAVPVVVSARLRRAARYNPASEVYNLRDEDGAL